MGNTNCPVTRFPLADLTVIPNHTLRRLIKDWCCSHGVDRIPTPKQPADPALVRRLLSQASAVGDATDARVAAIRRLRALATESEKNRALISANDTRSEIFEMAFDADREVAVEAMEALAVVAVAVTEMESEAVAAVPGRVAWLAGMIRGEGSADARIGAAAVVEGMRSPEAIESVGAAPGVIEGLVALVEKKEDCRAARAGVRGLFCLCLTKENRNRAVTAGAVAAVLRWMGEMRCWGRGDLERGLATVELLCRGEGGREAVVGVERAVETIVGAMAGKASARAGEHAAGVLVAVVEGSEALQKKAVEAGVVKQLLLMVQSGCSERGRRKAQRLLKLFRPLLLLTQNHFVNSDYFLQPF